MAKFRTKARAVDMLGRQQIADVSTAISELFKNAHDAYADHVEVDLFCSDGLMVIRDDGSGMTKDVFENNWLVLGTDSKCNNQDPEPPKGKKKRSIMGEKGIGRLAIALLGSQVLVLTRSEENKFNKQLTMCFINWRLFEQPELNIEDIEFPVKVINDGKLPSKKDVSELLKENIVNISELKKKYSLNGLMDIIDEIKDFQFDPVNFDKVIGGLTLSDGKNGTHFYIAPTNESIYTDIEAEKKNESKEFSKCLLGFCNSTFGIKEEPEVLTAFRYWSTDTDYEDIIGENEFFTKKDVKNGDQFVSGWIDEYGQFKGNVRIYENEISDHIITWRNGGGKPTDCGPFQVEFAYLQGTQRDSIADVDDFNRINKKLSLIGGIYVFKDGLRILPYGNSDVDWLNIEERRNRGMGYYFFSYRRIYGAVCLTKKDNNKLKEKAGREGFQKGKAYKQLTDILENLFIQLAADFFRSDSIQGDFFNERKEELKKIDLARKKREKQISTKRKNLLTVLEVFFNQVQEEMPESEIEIIKKKAFERMAIASNMKDTDAASRELLRAESEAMKSLAEIRKKYIVTKPRGVGLSKQLVKDWEAYQLENRRLELELFNPTENEIARTLGEMAKQAKIFIDQRKRLQDLIKQVSEGQNEIVRRETNDLQKASGHARRAAVNTARSALKELKAVIVSVENDLAHKDLREMSVEEIEEIRVEYENRIDIVAKKNTETLSSVRQILSEIAENLEQKVEGAQLDVTEAIETELEVLKEQADNDEEMVQLGLAVAVINHEFAASIKTIRREIRELRSWANSNEDLFPLYQNIKINFDHLDAHLNLFTPLQRRLYRKRIDVEGKEISQYIRSLFSVRFDRHKIVFDVTDSFLNSTCKAFPSTIYPVFVNIIDNYIFWLSDCNKERIILLDYKNKQYFLENTGPKIQKRDAGSIFERGFSRKPHGRGLGLYISKRVLNKEGMDIDLDVSNKSDSGVKFIISFGENDDE